MRIKGFEEQVDAVCLAVQILDRTKDEDTKMGKNSKQSWRDRWFHVPNLQCSDITDEAIQTGGTIIAIRWPY